MVRVSSSFTGSENPLSEGGVWDAGSSLSSIWVNVQKVSGVLETSAVNASFNAIARRNSPSFNREQFSEAAIVARDSNSDIVVAVRLQSNGSGYFVDGESASGYIIYETDGTTNTAMGAGMTPAPAAGDVVRLTASGAATTTLELKINGSVRGTRTDSTSPYTTGQPGVGAYNNAGAVTDVQIDNWSGGDVYDTAARKPGVASGGLLQNLGLKSSGRM